MAISLISVWGHTPRPWGYEIRADYRDGDRIYNEVFVFQSEPSSERLNAIVAERLEQLEQRKAAEIAESQPPAPEYSVICEDGTVVEI